MTPAKQGYLVGYFHKNASWLTALGETIKGIGGLATQTAAVAADRAFPLIAAAPPLAGVLAGGLASKATSPSEMDAETMQSAIELAELQEMEAEMRRKAELEEENNTKRGVKDERTLRI